LAGVEGNEFDLTAGRAAQQHRCQKQEQEEDRLVATREPKIPDPTTRSRSREPGGAWWPSSAPTYIPLDDVDQTLLAPSDTQTYCPYKGDASYYSITLPDGQDAEGRLADAVWSYREPYDRVAPIADHVAFYADHVAFYADRVEVVVGAA
jgi:hypothetical protein